MIYIIAHLYTVPGLEEQFHEYEQRALSIFHSHGGELILACRPETSESTLHVPSEIHVLRIGSAEAFRRFQNDPRLNELQEMRRAVIQDTQLFLSQEPVDYLSGAEGGVSDPPNACSSPQDANA